MRIPLWLLGLTLAAGCPAPNDTDDTDAADTDADTDVVDTDVVDTDVVDTDLEDGTLTVTVSLDDGVVCDGEGGDCVGDLFVGVFVDDPLLEGGAEPLTGLSQEDADLSAGDVVVGPSESIPAGTYYVAAFMDENGSGTMGPDEGDLVVTSSAEVVIDGDASAELTLFRF